MRQDEVVTDNSPSTRRRRRRTRQPAEAEQAEATAPPASSERRDTGTAKARRRGAGRPADGQPGKDSDRGWRELLGNAPSQVGVNGAMRARDVARPSPAELAAAERDLVIARRQWRPPAEAGR